MVLTLVAPLAAALINGVVPVEIGEGGGTLMQAMELMYSTWVCMRMHDADLGCTAEAQQLSHGRMDSMASHGGLQESPC